MSNRARSAKEAFTVAEVLDSGEIDVEVGHTLEDVLASAGSALDAAGANDITGVVAFVGSDGRNYIGTVEFVVIEASPEYWASLRERLREDEEYEDGDE